MHRRPLGSRGRPTTAALLVAILAASAPHAFAQPTGPTLVRDIRPGAASALVPVREPAPLGDGTLLFVADDGVHGPEVWRSDGSAAGTALVLDIYPGAFAPYGVAPSQLTAMDGTVFFTAIDEAHGQELWRSDGTAGGTVLVRDIVAGPDSGEPRHLTAVGGTLFFQVQTGTGRHYELWRSDGTASGTERVRAFDAAADGSELGLLTDVSGTLFFVADDGVHGREPWRSDGTTDGTVLVRDIQPGPGSSVPPGAYGVGIGLGGVFFLQADDGVHGREPWRSDGTTAGTALLRDIQPGTASGAPGDWARMDGILYFGADDGVHGRELWRSDGTTAGTALVRDIYAGPASAYPAGLVEVHGRLFLAACDATDLEPPPGASTGCELWTSDGTADGTVLLADINPGPATSLPSHLTALNGVLHFVADDGLHGREPWTSDGTDAGTLPVGDIAPGATSSTAADPMIVPAGACAAFAADDGVHGRELWRVAAPSPVPPRLDPLAGPLVVGAANTVYGAGFTAGSVVMVFVATAAGAVSYGPYAPTARGADWFTWTIPAAETTGPCAPQFCLGSGFASAQVVNIDTGYLASNVGGALLAGEAGAGIPTITRINGASLAPADLAVAVAHIDTVVTAGTVVTIEGTGFDDSWWMTAGGLIHVGPPVNLFTAAGNVGPLEPFPGGTTTRIQVTLPADLLAGPGTFQVVNASNWRASNAVAAVINTRPNVLWVSASGSTITVVGTGFSTLSVINVFNEQGGGVVNLGGFGADGRPRIPLTVVNATMFRFERPAGAVPGPAFVEVLNPPFVPFASSGADPDAAFPMP
jgi:ELWxxDGT repeat protein